MKKVKKILEAAAECIYNLKFLNGDESIKNIWRGKIQGLLEAAEIISGNSYDWDTDGIYENSSNEPIIEC